MIDASQLPVPETFQARPYARAHYSRIASWALANHPFYQDLVRDPAELFPIVSRLDVQLRNAALLNGHEVTAKTSGSTSTPVEVSWSPERTALDHDDSMRYAQWMGGVLPSIRLLALSSHSPNEHTMDVLAPVEEQVEFILRRFREAGACSIITYPSNLEIVSRYVVEQSLDMSFIRRCSCLSECFEPYHERLARQAFPNAYISATYSSVEVGLIAARCPYRPENYHIMAHKLGVEFLDDNGRPCRDGEVGTVVVTDYTNRRTPFIRYALGDLAAPATCGCGRIPLPAMTELIGKVRGVLKGPGGRPVVFTGLSPMFRDSPEIRQFQVVQTDLGNFQVRYVPRPGMDMEPFLTRVRERFQGDFGPATLVEFEPMDEIPRSPGGKFHGAICLV